MSNYGRNFEFRVPPTSRQRGGRFSTPTTGSALPMGIPVHATTTRDDLDRQVIALAAADDSPKKGQSGIAIYEHGDGATWAGDDPFLTTYSDKDTLPKGKAIQVVSGEKIKVVLRNTVASTFLNTRDYTGRKMVDLTGLAVGNFLTPGTGNDTDGYWKKTVVAGDEWLVVTKIDTDRGEVEAEFLF